MVAGSGGGDASTGGTTTVQGGPATGVGSAGGLLQLFGGDVTSGAGAVGGDVYIAAGTAASGNSGQILLQTGNLRTTRMAINEDGNVGIGTTNPNRLLEVAGPIRLAPAALPGSPGAGDIAIDSSDSNRLKFYNGTSWQTLGTGTGSGDFLASGIVPMTGALRSIAGTASAPGITFSGDTDNGIFAPTADNFAITTVDPKDCAFSPRMRGVLELHP